MATSTPDAPAGSAVAASTARSSIRAMARVDVRTRSSGTMCPSRSPRIGLIDSAEPTSAPALPIRPPRRRYSRVST